MSNEADHRSEQVARPAAGWPTVGTQFRARADKRLWASAGEPHMIEVSRGALLEVVSVDERWDNTHAMIVRDYHIRANLRVLDGPRAGEVISISTSGSIVDGVENRRDPYCPPGWLEPVLHSNPGT